MPKNSAPQTFDLCACLMALRQSSWKIRGVSYLLENFENESGPPLDERTAWEGIALILSECAQTIETHSLKMEEHALLKYRNSKS